MSQKIHPPSESTATFIKNRLSVLEKDYPYNMWKSWCQHLSELDMKGPKYSSFKVYLRVVVHAGLIRRTSTPPDVVEFVDEHGLKPFKRSYYELVPEQIGNEESWRNPQVAVHGERVRLGKRRYRRKILGIPPMKRGRPRKEQRKYEI